MSEVISITANGVIHKGWTNVSVTFGIESLAPSFSLSLASRWNNEGPSVPIPSALGGGAPSEVSIREGDECTIEIDGDLAITGYVDRFNENEAPGQHDMSCSGRAVTGDLVDCSALLPGGKWQLRKKTIEKIVAELVADYDIAVNPVSPIPVPLPGSVDTGDPIKLFRIEPGETVHEALIRLTRQKGLLLQTEPDGSLSIVRRAIIPEAHIIQRGGVLANTKSGSYSGDYSDRFSQYILKSQLAGDDETSGSDSQALEEIVTDDEIKRHRPLLVLAESPSDRKNLKIRAAWERNRRAAGSEKLTYTVQGWKTLEGSLWQPNMLVRVEDDQFDVSDFMLVTDVTLSQNKQSGTTAQISVTGPEAYDVLEAPKRRRKSRSDLNDTDVLLDPNRF